MSVYVGHTHPLYGISSPERLDFPLVTVRYMSHKLMKQTHEPVSLKILCRTTTHVPRMYLDVEVGLCVNIPDLVDSRLQFSVLEDGRGFVGQD